MSKMYICVRDDFPDRMVPTLVAHAVLRHHLTFSGNYPGSDLYKEWLVKSFKKVVVKVGEKEFYKIMSLPYTQVSCENNTLEGRESCVTIVVSEENIPNVLKFAKLWKPSNGKENN